MVKYLKLRIVAPLQSWGVGSKGYNRQTLNFPTKSGITGILCNSLGIKRDETSLIQEMSDSIKVHARIDKPGKLLRDYGTIAYGKKNKQTLRYYLQDAKFLILIEAEEELLEKLLQSFKNPRNALFFGRKSCVPSQPIFFPREENYVIAENVENAFQKTGLLLERTNLTSRQLTTPNLSIEIIIETENSESETISDNPISFSSEARLYQPRSIKRITQQYTNKFYVHQETEIFINPLEER